MKISLIRASIIVGIGLTSHPAFSIVHVDPWFDAGFSIHIPVKDKNPTPSDPVPPEPTPPEPTPPEPTPVDNIVSAEDFPYAEPADPDSPGLTSTQITMNAVTNSNGQCGAVINFGNQDSIDLLNLRENDIVSIDIFGISDQRGNDDTKDFAIMDSETIFGYVVNENGTYKVKAAGHSTQFVQNSRCFIGKINLPNLVLPLTINGESMSSLWSSGHSSNHALNVTEELINYSTEYDIYRALAAPYVAYATQDNLDISRIINSQGYVKNNNKEYNYRNYVLGAIRYMNGPYTNGSIVKTNLSTNKYGKYYLEYMGKVFDHRYSFSGISVDKNKLYKAVSDQLGTSGYFDDDIFNNSKATVAVKMSNRINSSTLPFLDGQDLLDEYDRLVAEYTQKIESDEFDGSIADLLNPEELLAYIYTDRKLGSFGDGNYTFGQRIFSGAGLSIMEYGGFDKDYFTFEDGVQNNSLIGADIFKFSRAVFSETEEEFLEDEITAEESRIRLIATVLAFEEYNIDHHHNYGSVDWAKATIGKRLITQFQDDESITENLSDLESHLDSDLAFFENVQSEGLLEEAGVDVHQLAADLFWEVNFNNTTINHHNVTSVVSIQELASEPRDNLFTLFERVVETKDEVYSAIRLIEDHEKDEDDRYSLAVTRESVARAQLAMYGASKDFIDENWLRYVDQGSLSMMYRGNDSALADRLTSREADWYRSKGMAPIKAASYTITNIWEDQFEENMKILAKSMADKIILRTIIEEYFPPKAWMKRVASSEPDTETIVAWYGYNKRPDNVPIFPDNILLTGNTMPTLVVPNKFYESLDIVGRTNLLKWDRYTGNEDKTSFIELMENKGNYKSECSFAGGTWCSYDTASSTKHSIREGISSSLAKALIARRYMFRGQATTNEIALEILKSLVPLWGTIEDFQNGDTGNGVLGIFSDLVSFVPVGGTALKVGTGSAKASVAVSKTLKGLPKVLKFASKGLSGQLGKNGKLVGTVARPNKPALLRNTISASRSIAKSAVKNLTPVGDVHDLGQIVVATPKLARKPMKFFMNFNNTGSIKQGISSGSSTSIIDSPRNIVGSGKHGMPSSEKQAFADYANEKDMIIGVRPIDPLNASLIESKKYIGKNFHIKGKSSDIGPLTGFIPYDQSLSKKSIRSSQDNVDKYNKINLQTVRSNHAKPDGLNITRERIYELESKGSLSVTYDSGDEIVMDVISDDLDERFVGIAKEDGYEIYRVVDGQNIKVEVLTDPETGNAIIADYDLMSVIYRYESHGELDNRPLIMSHKDFKAQLDRYGNIPDELRPYYDDADLYYSWEDSDMGNVSNRVRNVISDLNAKLNRGDDHKMIHHSSDDANPFANVEDNFPAIFFVPDGLSVKGFDMTDEGHVIIETKKDLLDFYQYSFNNYYYGAKNKSWGDEFGKLRPSWFEDTLNKIKYLHGDTK